MSSRIRRRGMPPSSIRCSTSTRRPDAFPRPRPMHPEICADNKLSVDWILDTHPHADHFSAAVYLKEKTRRAGRDRQAYRRGAGFVEGDLQPARFSRRRLAMGPPVRRRRHVQRRIDAGPRHVLARAYARLDHLHVRRRRLHPRHAVSARHRKRALRLSRRQRGDALRFHHANSGAARRRRGCSPGTITSMAAASRDGNRPSPSRRRATSISGTSRRARLMSRCAKRATKRCRCRGSSCMRCNSTCAADGLPPPESNGRSYLKIPVGAL